MSEPIQKELLEYFERHLPPPYGTDPYLLGIIKDVSLMLALRIGRLEFPKGTDD